MKELGSRPAPHTPGVTMASLERSQDGQRGVPCPLLLAGAGGAVHLKGFLINPGREDPKGLLEAPRNPSFLNAAIVYLVLTRQQTPL